MFFANVSNSKTVVPQVHCVHPHSWKSGSNRTPIAHYTILIKCNTNIVNGAKQFMFNFNILDNGFNDQVGFLDRFL